MIKTYLQKIHGGTTLSQQEMADAVALLMEGTVSVAQTAAFLMGLAVRGETADELTGAARTMRAKALSIQAPFDAVDCCGTGGDRSGTYNISTTVALVAAACGIPVAKHGNRAASSKSGAADVLEALGVNMDVPVEALEHALREYNFAFLMATRHHEAMKHVTPIRRDMGVRTIFNLLGPLANPAGTKRQLLGVFDARWLEPMAQTLHNLGSEAAWVVHGRDGLDEITLTAPTDIIVLRQGHMSRKTLEAADFGLPACTPEELAGGDASVNAMALEQVLKGARNAYRNIVLANAAAVICIHDDSDDLKSAVARAAEAIDSGKALNVLDKYRTFTQQNGTK